MDKNIEYVYFIYDKNTRHTKIGKTINIKERVATLRISNPSIRLIYCTDGNTEKHYHSLFSTKRITGEWFNLNLDDYKSVIDSNTKLPRALFYSKYERFKPIIEMKKNTKEIEVDGYYFIGYEGLLWHSGTFWFNEIECKQVCNNGSLSIIIYGSSKKSVRKLRKQARPCKIKLLKEKLPF